MSKKNQHVVPVGNDWGVKGEGNKRFTVVTPTKAGAEKAGRDIAKNQGTELFIHGRDGKIQDRDSFGHDSCPAKDKKH